MLDLVRFAGGLGAARAGGCLLGSVAAPGGAAGWRWERGEPLERGGAFGCPGPDRVYVRDVLLTRGQREASTGRKLVSVLVVG